MTGEEEFKRLQEAQRRGKDDGPKGTVCICGVCGDKFGSANGVCALTCKNHRTKEQRDEYFAAVAANGQEEI